MTSKAVIVSVCFMSLEFPFGLTLRADGDDENYKKGKKDLEAGREILLIIEDTEQVAFSSSVVTG